MLTKLSRNRWLLTLGDILICLIATKLGQWIRLGRFYDIFDTETGASLVSIIIYILMIYIFDLNKIKNNLQVKSMIHRMAMAMLMAGVIIAICFYTIPFWKFGRGVFLVQAIFVFLLCVLWRFYLIFLYKITGYEENVLIIGSGKLAFDCYNLLQQQVRVYF